MQLSKLIKGLRVAANKLRTIGGHSRESIKISGFDIDQASVASDGLLDILAPEKSIAITIVEQCVTSETGFSPPVSIICVTVDGDDFKAFNSTGIVLPLHDQRERTRLLWLEWNDVERQIIEAGLDAVTLRKLFEQFV